MTLYCHCIIIIVIASSTNLSISDTAKLDYHCCYTQQQHKTLSPLLPISPFFLKGFIKSDDDEE